MHYEEFKKKFNIALNIQQDTAVQHVDGATLLLAVPGSGKTSVVVTRLGYMLYCKNIDPKHILTMTYTVAATNDMRKRFASIFGNQYSDDLEFRTINGVCVRIMMYYSKVKQKTFPTLLSESGNVMRLVNAAYFKVTNEYPSETDVKEMMLKIAYAKNMMYSSAERSRMKMCGKGFGPFYDAYEKILAEKNCMDYDDQLIAAWKILSENPDILEYFREKYRYINVDEAQDTSLIQHKIIELLAKGSGNIFMVGDPDQSIYGFRAAYPKALLSFKNTYHDACILLMEQNYRSTSRIVDAANAFIKRNRDRYDKNMRTDNSKGNAIEFTRMYNREQQAMYIAKKAARKKEDGGKLAVLYRNNDSVIPLIDLLDKKNITYRCRGIETLFFANPVVKDISNIIRLAFDPYDVDVFLSVFYKINMGIRKADAMHALAEWQGKRTNIPVTELLVQKLHTKRHLRERQAQLNAIRSMTSSAAISEILHAMNYANYLDFCGKDASCSEILLILAAQNPEPETFLRRLEELKCKITKGNTGDKHCPLVLSTIHSSKGLEYDNVIIMDVIDKILPNCAEDGEDIEEERRLFYVGITRAKRDLEVIYINKMDSSIFTKQLYNDACALEGRSNTNPTNTIKSLFKRPAKQHPASSSQHKQFTLALGDVVHHTSLGSGVVMALESDIITVKFVDGGLKKLSLPLCMQNNLLTVSNKTPT